MTVRDPSLLIGLLHWNPHWQCFEKNPTCAGNATKVLSALFSEPPPSNPVDFAHVIEFEDAGYKPPAGWSSIAPYQSCGSDWDTLFYSTNRWTLLNSSAGCLTPSRSFSAGRFRSVGDPGLVVTVFGAHFPQTLNASTHAYADATASVRAHLAALHWTPGSPLVFMADTNTEGPAAAAAGGPTHRGVNRTNGQLFADIGAWPAAKAQQDPPGAPLFKSCCYSDGFSWEGDRVLSNFGYAGWSTRLFEPTPAWAAFPLSEFHRGVRVELVLPDAASGLVEART